MNSRERFLEVMSFNPNVRACKWEFGYWGGTVNRWYQEGLPEKNYPAIATKIATIHSTVFTTAWSHEWRKNKNLFELTYGERQRKIEPVRACRLADEVHHVDALPRQEPGRADADDAAPDNDDVGPLRDALGGRERLLPGTANEIGWHGFRHIG